MSRRLVPVFVLVALLVAAIAAAEPCPDTGAVSKRRGGQTCEDRGLPGAAALGRPEAVAPPPALGAPLPTAAPAPLGEGGPSLVGALVRLFVAVVVLAGVMVACILGYRRLVQRAGTQSGMLAWATGWVDDGGADAVRVASRRYLGGRESVAVIHAGGERFLVGITAGQVSLLARLETPVAEPMPDFTEALTRAGAARPPVDEVPSAAEQFRAAMERSRERLGRLAHLTVVPRDERG